MTCNSPLDLFLVCIGGLSILTRGGVAGPSNASSVVVSHAKSTAPPTVQLNMKRPYAGLEKSVKDLHRQTLALTRIKMTLADEMERCYKMVTRVFEDLNAAYVLTCYQIKVDHQNLTNCVTPKFVRRCHQVRGVVARAHGLIWRCVCRMNEREADLIFEMDKVKDEAGKYTSTGAGLERGARIAGIPSGRRALQLPKCQSCALHPQPVDTRTEPFQTGRCSCDSDAQPS